VASIGRPVLLHDTMQRQTWITGNSCLSVEPRPAGVKEKTCIGYGLDNEEMVCYVDGTVKMIESTSVVTDLVATSISI
jgi:hypothetical protein